MEESPVEVLKLTDIVYEQEKHPRKAGYDPGRVARYAACMRDGLIFPPIKVQPALDGRYPLLDGLHRCNALKEIGKAEVSAQIIHLNGADPLLYAAECQDGGKDLTDADAEDVARRTFQSNPKATNREIAKAVHRGEATVSGYLRELRAKHELAQDLTIFKMGLLGIPQERIAQRLGMPQETIRNHLAETSELKNQLNTLLERGFGLNTIAEKLGWPEPLVWAVALEGKSGQERFEALEWNIRPWDYWSWGDVDHRFGDEWEGRIPAQLVAHALYFFTKVGALVFDPMAGGGVTPDVCLALDRRCWSFDKEDRPDGRPEIEPYWWDWDGLEWPVSAKAKPDMIFFDPPYYKKNEEAYGEKSISALERDAYLRFFRDWGALAAENSKPTTRLALLVADWWDFQSTPALEESPEKAITIFDYLREMSKHWELTRRIEAPLSTQRFTGPMVSAMQERRILGTVSRTLLMLRRRNG